MSLLRRLIGLVMKLETDQPQPSKRQRGLPSNAELERSLRRGEAPRPIDWPT